MAKDSEARAKLLKAEIVRLQNEIVILNRQWSRKHWLGAVVLIAIPLMILHVEPLWVALSVIAAPCLVATQAYLLYVRRRECVELIAEARRDLTRVEAGAPSMRASIA